MEFIIKQSGFSLFSESPHIWPDLKDFNHSLPSFPVLSGQSVRLGNQLMVSSANSLMSLCIEFGMSFMYVKKRQGQVQRPDAYRIGRGKGQILPRQGQRAVFCW